jgi:hypothetical protein
MSFASFNQSYSQGLDNLLKKYQQAISGNPIVQSAVNQQEIDKRVAEYKETQVRSIALEDSIRKWNESINRIIIIFVITFFAVFLVILIYIYFVPQLPITIILIIVISTGTIFAMRQYYDTTSRYPGDYDEYNFNPPILVNPPPAGETAGPNMYSQSDTSALLSGVTKNCIGSYCCADGTSWDYKTGKCMKR